MRRPLGRSSLAVSPIMLGANLFGWTTDDATAFSILDRFVDTGFNAIDTSDAYSLWVPGHVGGESELAIGRWLRRRGKRDDVVIATKVGARPLCPNDGSSSGWRPDLSASYILESVEASLKRLGTDYIDLYQSHVDDEAADVGETLGAFDSLIKAGKVRVIGASNFTSTRLSELLKFSAESGLPRYETCQSLYNLLDRSEMESGIQALARAENVGILCYSALAKGFLSGGYREPDSFDGGVWARYLRAYVSNGGLAVVRVAENIARAYDATTAQVCLSWLLQQPGVTSAIVSVANVKQWDEISGTIELKLGASELASLTAESNHYAPSVNASQYKR